MGGDKLGKGIKMFASKITMSKETKEKMEKGLSVRERGKLLFARLQELDNNGTLSKATCRADVATMVGYTTEQAKAGYSWVSNLIRRGNLSETMLEWSPSGRMVAEYHVKKSPDYDYQETKRRTDSRKKRAEKVAQELRRWQDKVEAGYIPQVPEPQVYDEKQVASDTKILAPIKIEITRGDMTIKVEMDNHEEASKLITTIMKGE